MNQPLRTIMIGEGCRSLAPWAVGQSCCLLEETYQRLLVHGSVVDDRLEQPQGLTTEDVSALRLQAAYIAKQPLSARLPISYRWVPGKVRSWLANRLGRHQRLRHTEWAAFPRWPLDLSADMLADLVGEPSPWRHGPTPVVLTHDLDSPEGMTNLVEQFLGLEERYDARSTNFIVPCGWTLNHSQLRTIQQRGHDLGIHGYDHSHRTAFVKTSERQQRLRAGAALAQQYGMIGYRAPSLIRTEALLADLRTYFRFDSSIPTSGGLFPAPNNGCATARPFALAGIVELPLSLPRDGSMLFLGYSPEEILEHWITVADRIAASGGVVVLLTHCERRFSGNPAMLEVYEQFLRYISESERFCWATANGIAASTAVETEAVA